MGGWGSMVGAAKLGMGGIWVAGCCIHAVEIRQCIPQPEKYFEIMFSQIAVRDVVNHPQEVS